MKTLHILAPPPALAQQGYTIMNASRPLVGDVTWQADFIHGSHYAAVKGDNDAARTNESLGACVLKYYTEKEARATLIAHYKKQFAGKPILKQVESKLAACSYKQLQEVFHSQMNTGG